MRMMRRGCAYLAALAALMAAAGGCAAPAGQIAGAETKLPADQTQPAFLDRVAEQGTVTENDATAGVLMVLGEDASGAFSSRIQRLRELKAVDDSWSFDAARPLTKGRLAYMVYQVCRHQAPMGMRGGLILELTGPSQRYCLKELQFRGIMSPGLPYTPVAGMEFVAVLNRAEVFRRTGEIPGVLLRTPTP